MDIMLVSFVVLFHVVFLTCPMDQEHMQIDDLDYTLRYRDTCSCENWSTANLTE